MGSTSAGKFYRHNTVILDNHPRLWELWQVRTFKNKKRAEQLADYLREELLRGAWTSQLPGSHQLATVLGVGHGTMESALDILEQEGLLQAQGVGCRRKITLSDQADRPSLRIRVLPYERADREIYYLVDLVHRLRMDGHAANFTNKSLIDLKMDLGRVQRFVEREKADAWVIGSGSREVLEWFAQSSIPAFALLGRHRQVAIAASGPDKIPAQRDLLERLILLGHRRIVLLAREERRHPRPGRMEQAFLDCLLEHGIPTGQYNLPDWEERPGGIQKLLDSLLSHTPPTALFIQEIPLFFAVQQHLAMRGFVAPRDVSLISDDPDPAFTWCQPTIAHIRWDVDPIVRRVLRWAERVAAGKEDRRKSYSKATFVEGGSIGPAPRTRQ